MANTQAWQHIYANVEKDQSPRNRGGFQTLFYTSPGLTEAEIEEMEGRLLYFPSQVEPVKRLFFMTSAGKGVVAQLVPLPDPDQMGRKGRYLAHSLIFAPEALAQFGVDPFRVFRHFTFITTVAEALAQGDFQTGNIPPVSLELPAEPAREIEAAHSWPAPELKKLALLALRAGQYAQAREVVTLAGDPAYIEKTLAAAFLAVPTALRPHCTFDTYFYRCNLVATYFWAIGLPEPPVSVKFALLASPVPQVQGAVSSQPETAYEHWTMAMIETQQLAELVRDRDQAFALGEWLDDRKYELAAVEAAPSELITAVFKANPQPVRAALRRRISKHLPPALSERVAGFVYQQATEVILYRHLRQGFEQPELLALLAESYTAQQLKAPPQEEMKALETLLEQVDHSLLRLYLASWRSPRKQLPRELGRASEADYRYFSEMALRLKLVDPFDLLVPGRGETFLDLYLAAGAVDLMALIKALLEAKETDCLVRLIDKLPRLSAQEVRQLAKLITKHPDMPELFQTAVQQAHAALPAEGRVKRILGWIWPSQSEKGHRAK